MTPTSLQVLTTLYVGPVSEIQATQISGNGLAEPIPVLDLLVLHKPAADSEEVPFTFRLLGPLASHWKDKLIPGDMVHLVAEPHVDTEVNPDGEAPSVYFYWLVRVFTKIVQ